MFGILFKQKQNQSNLEKKCNKIFQYDCEIVRKSQLAELA